MGAQIMETILTKATLQKSLALDLTQTSADGPGPTYPASRP